MVQILKIAKKKFDFIFDGLKDDNKYRLYYEFRDD